MIHSFLPIFSSISSLYDRIHYYPFLRIVHNSKWFDDNRWRLRNERRWIFLRLKVARLKARRGEVPVVWKRVLERSPKARGLRFEGWNYSWHVVHPRAYNGPTALSRASPLHKVGVNLSLPFYSAHASFQGWPDKRRTREMGPRFPRFFPSLFWLTRSTSKRARCYRPITRNSFEGRVEYPAVRFIEFLLAFRSPISPRYIYIYTVVVSLKENSVAIPRSMKEREREKAAQVTPPLKEREEEGALIP